MVKQPVTIKGNIINEDTVGMTVNLDPYIAFPYLLSDVAAQFEETGKFFRNAKVILAFEGRELSPEDQEALLQTIQQHAPIKITYVVDSVAERGAAFQRLLENVPSSDQALENTHVSDGQFYHGNLKDGQRLEMKGDIIIAGSVLAGARVIASGNIIVIGALKGHAYAGMSGRPGSYIIAMDMMPTQLRIGEYTLNGKDAECAGKRMQPVIARVSEGRIIIRPLKDFNVSDL